MNNQENLIQSLSYNLAPVQKAVNSDVMALLWLLASGLYVMLASYFLGPIRPNALAQLMSEPRFLIEILTGLIAITLITLVAFRAAIPGALSTRLFLLALGLLGVWLSSYLLNLVNPALEPSMLGKREHCGIEIFIYAPLPIALAFGLTRRLYPLKPWNVTVLFSLAAGLLPALYMQLACMYIPVHILQFHIVPGIIVGFLGFPLALLYRHSLVKKRNIN